MTTVTRRPALALALALCLPAARGIASDQACSATTSAAFDACLHAAEEDYLIGFGKCLNLSDTKTRKECLGDAATARDEARNLCVAQRKVRRSVCRALGEDRYDPEFVPARFDEDFTNPPHPNRFFPLAIGNRWEYGGAESVTVEVLNKTKRIDGVTCIVSNDRVTVDGELHEDTDDWFAQAKNGDVFYCGEAVKDFESFEADVPAEPELVSIQGSFKTGRDGDQPGLAFPGLLTRGRVYRQEFSLGTAEDMAEILSTSYAFGSDFELDRYVPQALAQFLCAGDCVVVKEYSPLAPGAIERKFYAPGIGLFLGVHLDTGEVVQLENCSFDARCAVLPIP